MSESVHDPQASLEALQSSVRRVLDELARLRREVTARERRLSEAEAVLRQVGEGQGDPVAMQRQIGLLQAENEQLRARLQEGREGVDRLLSRVRFLEERK